MESTSPSDLPFFTFCFFTGEQKLGLCCVLVRWQASAAVWWHASNELNFSNETLMVTYGSIEACDYIIYTYILHYSILVWTGRSDISQFLLILNDLFSAPGKRCHSCCDRQGRSSAAFGDAIVLKRMWGVAICQAILHMLCGGLLPGVLK